MAQVDGRLILHAEAHEDVRDSTDMFTEYANLFDQRPEQAVVILNDLYRRNDPNLLHFLTAFPIYAATEEALAIMSRTSFLVALTDILCDVRRYEVVSDPAHPEQKNSMVAVSDYFARYFRYQAVTDLMHYL